MYKRPYLSDLYNKIKTPRKFIQLILGPRQVGKTTIMNQLQKEIKTSVMYTSADDSIHKDRIWLNTQWIQARQMLTNLDKEAILIVDEVQKIKDWSEIVKSLWDQDTRNKINLKVILLGSSALQLTKGSSESLAGRFEITYIPHWSYLEMKKAFQFNFEKYLFFGGYPGAADLTQDETRWKQYILKSIIESVVNLDILSLARIEKPALLKKVFYLGCEYSGQILSYTKMQGQLQDAGNTTTVAHYLDLLSTAGLVTGLQKWTSEKVRIRGSSPKLNVYDLGLMSSMQNYSQEELKINTELRGRVVESAVGAYLIQQCMNTNMQLYYWNEGNTEVDFIIEKGKKILAIEVKSGRKARSLNGMSTFLKKYPKAIPLLVGAEGIPVEEFLQIEIETLF